MKFYLMWVAGKGMPKRVHETLQGARDAAHAYKSTGGTRACYILAPVESTAGRKLLTVRPRMTVDTQITAACN